MKLMPIFIRFVRLMATVLGVMGISLCGCERERSTPDDNEIVTTGSESRSPNAVAPSTSDQPGSKDVSSNPEESLTDSIIGRFVGYDGSFSIFMRVSDAGETNFFEIYDPSTVFTNTPMLYSAPSAMQLVPPQFDLPVFLPAEWSPEGFVFNNPVTNWSPNVIYYPCGNPALYQ